MGTLRKAEGAEITESIKLTRGRLKKSPFLGKNTKFVEIRTFVLDKMKKRYYTVRVETPKGKRNFVIKKLMNKRSNKNEKKCKQ